MATTLIQPPKRFEPGSSPAETWSEWKAAYLLYEEACEYNKKSQPTRRALLLHVLGYGPSARKTVATFDFQSTETQTLEAILTKFDERYTRYQNVAQAAALFSMMVQKVRTKCG